MTVPSLRVEIASSQASPTEIAPTWLELDEVDVLAFSMTEGRTSATDLLTQPSTAAVTFDNSTRTYDPLYSSGSLYGMLTPGRQIRVTAIEADNTEHIMFRGVVGPEGWQQRGYKHPAVSSCVVSCLDPAGYLASQPADLPPFEAYLRRIAVDHGLWGGEYPRVLHWPLDDPSGWSGQQTFVDPVDNDDIYSPYGVESYYTAAGVQTIASAVRSDVALRGSLSGSVDSALGAAECSLTGIGSSLGFGSSSKTSHKATFGFALRLRSFPTIDLSPIVADSVVNNGYFVDRDGGLVAIYDEGTTQLSTDTGSDWKLQLDTDYLICSVWDGTTLSLYVDGVLQAENGAYPSLGNVDSTLTLSVGGRPTSVLAGTAPAANVCDVFVIGTPLTAAEVLTLYQLWSGFEGMTTGDAAASLLDGIGIANNCTAGRVGLAEMSAATAPAALLQQFERTELGRLYWHHADEQFELVTYQALATGTRHTVPQFTLSDTAADTGAGYVRFGPPTLVNLPAVNTVTASNADVSWTLTSQTSIAAYGVGAVSTSLSSAPDADPLAVAQWMLELTPDPVTAVQSVTVTPTSEAEFATVLDSALFDMCTLKRKPHDIGTTLETSQIVEGRSFTIGDGAHTWQAIYFLREHDAYPWWLWGSGEFETGTSVYDADRNGKKLGA